MAAGSAAAPAPIIGPPTHHRRTRHHRTHHTRTQDGQEFLKLLLQKLEGLLASSPDAAARALIPSLFRGTYSYVTTCGVCSRASRGSSRANDFYELPLQVQGAGGALDSSLVGARAQAAGLGWAGLGWAGRAAGWERGRCSGAWPPAAARGAVPATAAATAA